MNITDKIRLDWISKQNSGLVLRGDGWVFIPGFISGNTTIRKAIDSAILHLKTNKPNRRASR